MKDIIFDLTSKFKLSSVASSHVYELENYSSKIIINHHIREGFVYELHKAQEGFDKELYVLNHVDGKLELLVSNAFLKNEGEFEIQISATDGSEYIISNIVKMRIERFINASLQPTPEEESEIQKLLAKAELLAEKADELETLDVAPIDEGIRVSYKGDAYDIVNGKDGKDYIITDADYQNIADKVEEDIDVDGINNRLNTLDNETLDIYGKLEKKADAEQTEASIDALGVGITNMGASLSQAISQTAQTLHAEIEKKQNKLKAGANIQIDPETNEISATGGGGEGDVTKAYLEENYYDKAFMNAKDTLIVKDDGEEIALVEERDISYSAIPLYCGKWVDGSDIHRRVYVVTSGIAKGNTIKVADKPANMKFLVRGFGIVEGTQSATKHTMTNSDISVYVNDDGVYAVNNFTGYAERLYVVLEYTVEGESV